LRLLDLRRHVNLLARVRAREGDMALSLPSRRAVARSYDSSAMRSPPTLVVEVLARRRPQCATEHGDERARAAVPRIDRSARDLRARSKQAETVEEAQLLSPLAEGELRLGAKHAFDCSLARSNELAKVIE